MTTPTDYTPTPINVFEQYTMTSTWNTVPLNGVIVKYTRINNQCTMQITWGLYQIGTNIYNINTNPPVRFAPTNILCVPILVEANSANTYSYIYINTNGTIYSPAQSGVYSDGGARPVGLNGGSGTYWTLNLPAISYTAKDS
jgi:hypothetical protein